MNTYRDILKWGDKHDEALDAGTLRVLTEEFGIDPLAPAHLAGDMPVKLEKAPALSATQIEELHRIVGTENLVLTDFDRATHAYGKYYTDLLQLRLGKVPTPPDAVVYPQTDEQIAQIVAFCHEHEIALTPFGAASSVTRGVETPKGGLSIDLTRHMNHVLDINTTNQTATVQAGMYGPEFEKALNAKGLSCGHFPQSFEFSTVGGWVAARGAGQASTGYGKIEDMVLGMTVFTPTGAITTKPYPKMAQAWNLNEMFTGSEGALGVISSVTMKVVKHRPENRSYASFVFKSFASATEAMRQMIQAEYGRPHLFRISDPTETDVAFRTRNFNGSFSDKAIQTLGYLPGQRCLMFVAIEGDKDYTRFVKGKIRRTAKANGAFYIGQKPTRQWLKQRFHSAYLREPLMDKGIITDTLETAVSWQQLVPLWQSVQDYMRSRPNTVAMTHLSHIYESGANLYFTFLSPMHKGNEMNDYLQFHKGIVDAIVANGGSLSHHHGAGRVMAPWMQSQYGAEGTAMLQRIKSAIDPKGIMNPGVLGLH